MASDDESPGGGRNHTVRELQRSEERFRLLVESVIDYAIFVLDPRGTITTWNVGAERLKGYTEDEIIGRHYSTFYTEKDRAARLPDRLLATAREQGHVQISGWRVRKDGTRFWADVVITALWSDEGELAGFAKVTRDMTEAHAAREAQQRALEDQARLTRRLEDLDRWRRDFITSITHDLRTPVAAITGFTELLLEDVDDPEQRESLERILSNSDALYTLIEQLSLYTRLESNTIALDVRPIALDEFIDDLLSDMQPVLAGHPVKVEVPPIGLLADVSGLQRILRNLIGNASRHTPAGTPIAVSAERDDDDVTIEVRDRGGGISDDLRGRVFDRFAHGAGSGTGLGLAIVKQYVELHGGEVSVDSVAGEGTTFRVRLPAR